MAFEQKNLIKLAGANPSVHTYVSTDSVAAVTTSGYFNAATNDLKQGDYILITDTNAGAVAVAGVISGTGAVTVVLATPS